MSVLFQSVKHTVEASEEELALCPGLGPQKACQHFHISNVVFSHVHVELNMLTEEKCC